MISIAKPLIGDEEKKAVQQVMDSGIIAQGPVTKRFEEEFAKYIGVKYAATASSGTTALHMALLANGVGPGDEVITSAFTFIASANSILFCGAKPVFADIGEDYNIDPEKINEKITKRTKAIMPIHLYGQPADMKSIMEIARDRKLKVIEDACQAHGAEFGGKKVGSFATGCFSFYPTKNMTTSEGGMLTTDDKEVYDRACLLRAHGMPIRYHHDILGYNYRLTDIGSAIGLEQLKKLDGFNDARRRNAKMLTEGLSKIKGVIPPKDYKERKHVFHQYTIRLHKFARPREETIKMLNEKGVGSMIYYPIPIHKQKLYTDMGYNDKLPLTEQYSDEVISLPVHPSVTEKDVETIVNALKELS